MDRLKALLKDKHNPTFDKQSLSRLSLGTFALLLAGLAFVAPFLWPASSNELVGVCLVLSGMAEVLFCFRLVSPDSKRSGYIGSSTTIGMGFLVLATPLLLKSALIIFLALFFGVDGLQKLASVPGKMKKKENVSRTLLLGIGNLTVALLLVFVSYSYQLTVAIIGGLRLLASGTYMLTEPVHGAVDAGTNVTDELELPDYPELTQLAERMASEQEAVRSVDRGWVLVYLLTLFVIHIARMPVEMSIVGLLGPFIAVMGDTFVALIVSFGIILPGYQISRRLLKTPIRKAFEVTYSPGPKNAFIKYFLKPLLRMRLRFAIRMRQSAYSLPTALERGLVQGLPVAAVMAATIPMWGMNWYFDTENWASGAWDSYASHRTYKWRKAMVRATVKGDSSAYQGDGFMMAPDLSKDFSFIIIGDTGEGDASQLVLKDQLIKAGLDPDVRFLVISSDVIYPDGAMRDYEKKFFLPFKGFEKPIYAIPGNHDWYDALDSFCAVFFEPEAARLAIRARVEEDQNLSTTTDSKIEDMLVKSQFLSEQYQLNVGHQKAPYFQVQTEDFALIAVDTGVLRRVDVDQKRWLRAALKKAEGKFIMLLLGHPFFAEGLDWTEGRADLTEIRNIARQAGVRVVMAGDTHDFEYYREPRVNNPDMHHFVNGGGGAFMSYGPALAWPEDPALADSAIYPTRKDVRAKLDKLTPWYKIPMWWWTDYANAWPFSAKWLSAAFDYNQAPFHQSFVEIQVRPSEGVVRFIPWGVHGPLKWSDLQRSPTLEFSPAKLSDPAAFVIPFSGQE